MNYIPATLEEIERQLVDSPEGINGWWWEELRGCKILAVRTGPRIKKNVLIKPNLYWWKIGRQDLKRHKEKKRWVPVESLKIQEIEQ